MKGYWFVPGMGTSVKFYDGNALQLAKEILKLCLLLVALACLVLVTLFFYQERPTISNTIRDAHTTILEAGLTLKNVREASAEWKKASLSSQATAQHADKAIRDLDAFVRHTDFQLNQQVLPQTGEAIATNSAQLLDLENTASGSLAELNTALIHTTATVDAATADLANPAIAQSLQKVGEISANVATATSDAAATMASVRKGVEYEVHEITKPVSTVKKVVLFIAALAGKFIGI